MTNDKQQNNRNRQDADAAWSTDLRFGIIAELLYREVLRTDIPKQIDLLDTFFPGSC